MARQFVQGSIDWLVAHREGAFANRPPVPATPPTPKRPKWPSFGNYFGGYLAEHVGKPCPYCDKPMIGTRRRPTRDHVYPRRLGGTLSGNNRLIVCSLCNNDKRDMTLEQFAEHLTKNHDDRAAKIWKLVTLRKYQASAHP